MTHETISLFGTAVALLLPWLFGVTWTACLLSRSSRWNFWILAGHGYLAGMILTTLVLRLWDFCGFTLHYWGLVATISVLTFIGFGVLRTHPPASVKKLHPRSMKPWQGLLLTTLLLVIAYRYNGIIREILVRPLYPWDAWMNWAPKAITWYELGYLADYVSPGQWLQQPGDKLTYTTGAANAWKYPITVPLIQLWGMLGAGSVDQNVSNLPWIVAPIAFALSLYGHLKLSGASTLLATIACYVFLSVPIVNVHTALAGYADIWLAASFGAALLALHEWQQERHWVWASLSIFFAFSCSQLKLPGLVLGAIVSIVFLVSLTNFRAKTRLAIALLAGCSLLYVMLLGISFNLPSAGPVEISVNRITLPYLGSFDIAYRPVHQALLNSLFDMLNWNLLWHAFLVVLLAKIYLREFVRPPSLEFQCILLLGIFLLFIFYFTHFSEFVLDYSTVNRVLLYAVPAVVFYIFNSIHSWASSGLRTLFRPLTHESGNRS